MHRSSKNEASWRGRAVGLLIILALAAISTVVFFMDQFRRALEEGPRIVVLAAEARALQPGAVVWLAGTEAGRVTNIHFGDPTGPETRRVIIEAVLHRADAPFLRGDARAEIRASGLLAPVVLHIDPGTPGGGSFDFSDTLYAASSVTGEDFIPLSAAGRAALDTLLGLTGRLEIRAREGPGSLSRFRSDTVLGARLRRTAAGMRTLGTAYGPESGLGRILADETLGDGLRRATDMLGALTEDERVATVRDSVAAVAAAAERVSRRLAELGEGLRAGRGTAGRAAYDTELRDQSRALRGALDSTTAELARNPFRWLRLRIF